MGETEGVSNQEQYLQIVLASSTKMSYHLKKDPEKVQKSGNQNDHGVRARHYEEILQHLGLF